MSVTVFDHLHDPALILEGVGTAGAQLIIQTGTIVLNFQGSPGQDWVRDRMRHAVLDLPPVSSALLGPVVRATASAAPASMHYSPSPATGSGEQGLYAQGNVLLAGYADPSGAVNVGGPVMLPVIRGGPGAPPPPSGVGWAVDRTQAARVGTHIELVVDLAVAGPASLLRLAYSLFVTIAPRLVTKTDVTSITHDP